MITFENFENIAGSIINNSHPNHQKENNYNTFESRVNLILNENEKKNI